MPISFRNGETEMRKLKRKWINTRHKIRVFLGLELNYKKITDIELDGIDMNDYPDFCDAYIASATYKGRDMTESELEQLNQDSDYVYQKVNDHLW